MVKLTGIEVRQFSFNLSALVDCKICLIDFLLDPTSMVVITARYSNSDLSVFCWIYEFT